MNPVVPVVGTAVCRGLCVAAGSVTVTASAPIILGLAGILAGFATFAFLGALVLRHPNSSAKLQTKAMNMKLSRNS